MAGSRRQRVVIAGGGVAALEALLALRVLSGDRVEIELLAPDPQFAYRPASVADPFGRGGEPRFDLDKIVADQGASRTPSALAAVRPEDRVVVTDAEEELLYDHLLVAAGARPVAPLPGALTFRGGEDVATFRALLSELERSDVRSVAFALAPGVSWPLPLYELALLTAIQLSARGVRGSELHVVTHEVEPLALFGGLASQRVAKLLSERGVALHTSARPSSFEDGVLFLEGGGHVRAERAVAMPRLVGPWLEGLPHDAWGFIPADAYGAVPGAPDVYAAGDVTSYPLKQGGLATQQADAAARAIAAAVGSGVVRRPFHPVLRGLLMTGGAPIYMRAEPGVGGESNVAIQGEGESGPQWAAGTEADTRALWWPPSKIAGRYLGPYLATARPVPLGSAPLRDRGRAAGAREPAREDGGVALALVLADADARAGDYTYALRTLEAAEALAGALPPAYEAKRREWRDASSAVDAP
jgi:sulfide:quinone oxidoreductase